MMSATDRSDRRTNRRMLTMHARPNPATETSPTLTPAQTVPVERPAEAPGEHARFVGSIPEVYDRCLGPLLFDFAAADLARRVMPRLPRGARVLEVACGTGIATEHLWREAPPGVRIVATDLNEAMVAYARGRRGALSEVTFETADAQALPFADGTFDAVVCQFGIMFFPDKASALAEFSRVLKPGGLLAMNVWDSLKRNEAARIARDVIAGFFETDPPRFLDTPFGFHDVGTMGALIDKAGLRGTQVDRVSETVELPDAWRPARGFVEGNPGILEIQARASADSGAIVRAVAEAYETAFGPSPLQFRLREIVFRATKP
jgi:ubiquinone/menaquinone biosynthesis C-methylase UbiE